MNSSLSANSTSSECNVSTSNQASSADLSAVINGIYNNSQANATAVSATPSTESSSTVISSTVLSALSGVMGSSNDHEFENSDDTDAAIFDCADLSTQVVHPEPSPCDNVVNFGLNSDQGSDASSVTSSSDVTNSFCNGRHTVSSDKVLNPIASQVNRSANPSTSLLRTNSQSQVC